MVDTVCGTYINIQAYNMANVIHLFSELDIIGHMGGGDRCAVGCCNNDRRYPDKVLKHSHVDILKFHGPPTQQIQNWEKQLRKGRDNFSISAKTTKICSNHFQGISD